MHVTFQDEGKTDSRMSDYGKPPAADEVEVTLFGPGFGEAIAVHLGEGSWMLVDSCIDPDSKRPASLTYLDRLNVNPAHVKAIIASHWHDDHVRGISQISERYKSAEFFISSIFNDPEAASFLAAYSGSSAPGQARGTKELFDVVKQRDAVFPVQQRSTIFERTLAGRQVRATALSPVPAAVWQSIAHMASYLPGPQGGTPIKHATELAPNIEAVVIHIDFGDDAILLGADLEDHQVHGWSAVVADSWCKDRRPSTAYKVAHHGSRTGDTDQIWTVLLAPDPVACLTPFNRGKHRLPTEDDRTRIRARARQSYISSNATRKPDLPTDQLKRLNDIGRNFSQVNSGFGSVRLRKKRGATRWMVECFGRAQRL